MKKHDESLDALFDGRLKLYQSRGGYRFSLDAVLLAHFARLKRGEKVYDLGTGNGVVPLILADYYPWLKVTGVELQDGMVERARRNVGLNDFHDRVEIVKGDVRFIESIAPPESCDVVVCNPPFRGSTSGRTSPNEEKRMARHEMAGSLRDFLRAGVFLLRPKGRMTIIYPAGRAVDLLAAMRQAGVEPKRLRMIHSFSDSEATLILAEGVKGGRAALKVLSPLIVYRRVSEYSDELNHILAGTRSGESGWQPLDR